MNSKYTDEIQNPKAEVSNGISLRPAAAADEDFLIDLFASTREQELAVFGNDENLKRTFVKMQYAAVSRAYTRGDHEIIIREGESIGRIIVDNRPGEFYLVDISLLPSFRNRGIGTQLLIKLMDQARGAQKAVNLHVFKSGAAVRLYERLGFRVVGDDGVYLKMEWP